MGKKVMRVLVSTILIATLLPLGIVQAKTHVAPVLYTAYVNDTAVRLRSGPGTSFDILKTMDDGDKVTVSAETSDGSSMWCAVTISDGTDGYIRSDLLIWYGETNRSSVSIFSAPGDWNERLVNLPPGTTAIVTDSAEDTDGDLWYAVRVDYNDKEYTGYIYSPQLNHETDADFETHLKQEGFPESYKPYLRRLHQQHPNWVFLADEMPVSFDEALRIETVMGRSLYGGSYEAWRTMEEGAYNWNTGRYISFDSGSWYAAHPDVVAYYLDPRNSLDETGIYQFIGMSFQKSVHTVATLQTILNGSFMEGAFPEEGFETWADAIFAAAEENGMSPYALASMIIQEQGRNGIGNSISGTVEGYEGYYNFLNINAYADGERSAVVNGLIYAKSSGSYGRPWDSRYKAIAGGAAFYVKGYIAAGQDTLYLKKFDLKSAPYGTHQYMTNIQAAYDEAAGTKKGYALLSEAALVFMIPVYNGMPAQAIPKPTTTGNNNFYLNGLSVEGYDLNESFSVYKDSYSVTVPGYCETTVISASTSDSGATVTGTGEKELQVGENTFALTVTATSGRQKTYYLTVTRQSLPAYHTPLVDLSGLPGASLQLIRLKAYTDCEALLGRVSLQYATARIETADKIEKMGYAATGNRLVIYDEWQREYASYPLVVIGDVSGDGKLSLLDLSLMQRCVLGLSDLDRNQALAADVDQNGWIDQNDLTALQDHLVRKCSLL